MPKTFILAIVITFAISGKSKAQLTLEHCYTRAAQNYPLIRQRDLIERSREYSIHNASMGYLPTITLNGQQTYQSDVTKIPSISGQDLNIPTLSKSQFKLYGDINASLYDGGVIKQQKQMHDAQARIDAQSLDVELYRLNERVNQLYFGILLIDGQLVQQELLRRDIDLGLQKVKASIANGTALKSSGDILQAEWLRAKQAAIELTASRSAYLEMLALMIGEPINNGDTLAKPSNVILPTEVNRPELKLYDFQAGVIDIEQKMLNAQVKPRLSAFMQAGYGKPALNMLNTQADSYYFTGIRMNWNLSGFYTRNKEKELLELRRSTINLQRETFVFNNNYQTTQQRAEVSKLQQLAETDDEIIALRTRVKQTASIQLENGVIDSNDYLHEVNSENQARQSKVLHEIQLLLAQYTLQTTAGI